MKNLKTLVLVLIGGAMAVGLWWWWQHGKTYPSTDDAYLGANVVSIAPQVAGRVSEVAVEENSYVGAGDVLFQIDTNLLEAALQLAQARVDEATQAAGTAGSDVNAAAAQVSIADAALRQQQLDFDRVERLFRLKDVSQAAMDQAIASRDQAAAQKQAAEAALAAARDQLGGTGDQNAGIRIALAGLAQIDMDNATIRAPAAGWVANLTLRRGSYVTVGQPLFSLVEDGARFPEFLIDQGKADSFLEKGLRPWLFEEAIKDTDIKLTLRMHERYDHSYYFISTFMDDHLKWHAERLG